MAVQTIDIAGFTREQWLELRRDLVTASDVPALLGLSDYKSRLELYYEKLPDFDYPEAKETGPMRRGRRWEPVIANAVTEVRPDWMIEKAHQFFRDDDLKLGATPDFWIESMHGRGILQAKTCTPAVFKEQWRDGTVPPVGAMVQTLTEMMLTGSMFGACAAIPIDPYDAPPPAIFEVARDPVTEERIIAAAHEFWDLIDKRTPPEPDYNLDAELIATLAPHEVPGKVLDVTGNNDAIAAIHEIIECNAEASILDTRVKIAKAKLMTLMGDAERLTGVPGISTTWKTSHFKAYSVEARDKRVLRVTDKRKEEAA